jgi:hypothetical protein
MGKKVVKRDLPERPVEFCPVCWADTTGRDDITPEKAVAELKKENDRLRENIRQRDFDEYDAADLYAYWPTTFSLRNCHYMADWRSPSNMHWYEGRVSVQLNYGGGSEYRTMQYVDRQDYAEEIAGRLNSLIGEECPGFHWRMGIFFRQVGEHVEIVRRPSPDHLPIMLARIPAAEWDSIVASIDRDRARGES